MRIAILGAGAIAFGGAALLLRDGHDVNIWSPSGKRTELLATGAPLRASGKLIGEFYPRVAASCAQALADAETVLIAVPGYAYRTVLDAAAPHLRDDQVVIFSSHMSMAALYLVKLLDPLGTRTPIAALNTTITTGRQTAYDAVTIGNIRARLDVAVIPESEAPHVLALCQRLFGERFVLQDNLIAVALSNLNPQSHLAIALCNLTRMELAETWEQNRHLTPAVSRLIESLDAERLAIAKALNFTLRTVHEHSHPSFGVPLASLAEMARVLAERPGGVNGPTSLDSRYVTEDVPFGLVLTIRLAKLVGVDVPLHEAGLILMSALYGRDFEAENDILPEVSDRLANMVAIG
jgi:opine dehydrogenase